MKTRFFIAVLALMAFVGCDKENGNVVASVDGESAVLKVNLKATGTIAKAAAEDAFQYGTEAENQVSVVDFYFYDAEGEPYSVVTTGSNVINWSQGTAANVEKVSNAILVIKKSKTALPTHVVAVVNSEQSYSGLNLTAMATAVSELKTSKGFVMSNSVYVDGNGAKVIAAEIKPENVFTTDASTVEPGAELNLEGVIPVDIYVERVAAKVVVSPKGLMPVLDEDGVTQMVDAQNQPVFAKVLGWEITNCTDETYLLKSVNPEWTSDAVGFTPWNNAALCRSYWAATSAVPVHPYSYNAVTEHVAQSDYYYENTLSAGDGENTHVSTNGKNQTPQLLVAAKLVTEQETAVQLAKWYNVYYTIADLKTAMAGRLAAKLYVVDTEAEGATAYRSVGVDDVAFEQTVESATAQRYQVKVVPASGVTYYTYSGAEVAAITGDALDAVFADLAPAMMWNEGATYYYTNINHFGTATGMVRNHVYDINLKAVMGFGTPVYNPDHVIVPERPVEQETANLAAKINILSWHVVAQEVTLK